MSLPEPPPSGPARPTEQERINLRILTPGSGGAREWVQINDVPLTVTVEELKNRIRICAPSHPPVAAQRLIFTGRVLADNSATLANALGSSAQRNSELTLHMIVRDPQNGSSTGATATPIQQTSAVAPPPPASTNAHPPASTPPAPPPVFPGPPDPTTGALPYQEIARRARAAHMAAHEAALNQARAALGFPPQQLQQMPVHTPTGLHQQRHTPVPTPPPLPNANPSVNAAAGIPRSHPQQVVNVHAQWRSSPLPTQLSQLPQLPQPPTVSFHTASGTSTAAPFRVPWPASLQGIPNSQMLAQSFNNLRAQEQLLQAPQTMFLLSSPTGPHALIYHDDDLYSARLPSHETADGASTLPRRSAPRVAGPGNGAAAEADPAFAELAAAAAELVEALPQAAVPAAPAQPAARGPNLPFQQILNHFWLLVRVLFFAFFFLGDEGVTRYAILIALVVAFMIFRGLDAGRGIHDAVRGWWDGVMGVPRQRGLAQQGAPQAPPGANRQAPAQGAGGPRQQQGDEVLPQWRQRVRPVERALALFVASLWPGVGENTIRRRREEEQRAREHAEAVAPVAGQIAGAAAPDANAHAHEEPAQQSEPAPQSGTEGDEAQAEQPDGSEFFEETVPQPTTVKASGASAGPSGTNEGLRERRTGAGSASGPASGDPL